jgi:hypothetical protein
MDYYQSVVTEYIRADRSIFINTECCIQLNPSMNNDVSGPHWYCDAVACDFRNQIIFLCEITFSTSLAALIKRLTDWHQNWPLLKVALGRECHLPTTWPVRPWLFVPEGRIAMLLAKLKSIPGPGDLSFVPRITPLEMVQPWQYRSWDRVAEAPKPCSIPVEMQV